VPLLAGTAFNPSVVLQIELAPPVLCNDRFMAKPNLHAIRGKQNEWECSECKEILSGNKMQVVNSFGAHVRQKHKAPPKEDVNEVAARILREVTEKH